MPPIQLAILSCCTRCTSIAVPDCNINLSDLSAAELSCQICALLLNAAKAYHNNEEQSVEIVHERSWLKIGSGGPRILRLGCTPGECL
jgi:hypothetical protein